MVTKMLAAAGLAMLVLAPQSVHAQTPPSDNWHGTFAPLYFWASELNGDLSAGDTTVPLFLDFGDAADKLAGAFSFHFEAQKGRVGIFSDLNFIRLSSETTFTVPVLRATVEGDVDLDNTMFEIGGSYLVHDASQLAVIAGIRTYTLSPRLEVSTDLFEFEVIDASRTSVNAIVGATVRPQLAEKWRLLGRADVGGGGGFTWSGMIGAEFRPKPRIGLVFGYKALGIDVGSDSDDEILREYDVTHYGPVFGLNLHWGAR